MIDGADGGLRAIGVVGEEGSHHFFIDAAIVLRHTDILLFIDGFQLGVEQAQYQVGEAVALHTRPVLHLV